jgi:hypothetical protein
MVNYANGKIYKIEPICEHDEADVYIGSTTKKYLSQRMNDHLHNYNRWKAGVKKVIVTAFYLFDKYGTNNCSIELIENVNADSKDGLHAREGFYVRNIKCVNKYVPLRTRKEHYNDNKDKINEKRRTYIANNKEEIYKRISTYRVANKDKIKIINNNQYAKNREERIRKVKDYYEQNKERILENRREAYRLKKERLNITTAEALAVVVADSPALQS